MKKRVYRPSYPFDYNADPRVFPEHAFARSVRDAFEDGPRSVTVTVFVLQPGYDLAGSIGHISSRIWESTLADALQDLGVADRIFWLGTYSFAAFTADPTAVKRIDLGTLNSSLRYAVAWYLLLGFRGNPELSTAEPQAKHLEMADEILGSTEEIWRLFEMRIRLKNAIPAEVEKLLVEFLTDSERIAERGRRKPEWPNELIL